MPKATLSFDLPEENEEFILSSRAASWKAVSVEMDEWLRGLVKFGIGDDDQRWGSLPKEKRHEVEAVLQQVRDFLYDTVNGNGLDLYE